MLLVYFVIGAIPLGYLMGGRLSNCMKAPLKFLYLPCIALLIEASFGLITEHIPLPPSVWLKYAVGAEYIALFLFTWFNRRLRGIKLLFLATLTNFAVISANGFRMPVTPLIYENPNLMHFVERIESGALPEYVLVGWDAPLWFLGDTLAMFGGLASVGDLLMAAAMLVIIVSLMKTK